MPEFYGKWTTFYSRLRRWSMLRIFHKIFSFFFIKIEKKCIAMIDSKYLKVHRTACSMRTDGQSRKTGRSRGGITAKIHLLYNEESKPMDFIITGGQVHDVEIAPELVQRNQMKCLIGDKAYGSEKESEILKKRRI